MGVFCFDSVKMASTRAVLRQSQMLKKALFAGQIKPQTLLAARWGSGEPDQWNYLWRPEMKIPVTKEERAAAAKKYNMIEEDYVPYGPDEHPYLHMGDYPNIKPVGADERPGHHNWDFPNLKKDFGEPMEEDFYFHQATRSDTGRKYISPGKAFLFFLLNAGTFTAIMWFSPNTYFPITGPQLPANGPHYTFERADE